MWKAGQPHGRGFYNDPQSGLTYDGEFKEGKRCGKGVEILPGVHKKSGIWEDDLLNG